MSCFFKNLRLLVLPKLFCLLVTHLNRWNGRQYFSHWSPCFSFFLCLCYSRRTQLGLTQKNTKRLIGIQVLTKDFTSYKIFKKVTQLVKPINYWCLVKPINQLTIVTFMVRLIWSNLLNQMNLIMYTAKFETFLFDQISKN